jgi:RepB DNA-primase from phage plasmid
MHPAVEYFQALFDADDVLCITTISATETFKNGMPLTLNKFVSFHKVVSDAGIKRLTALNKTCHVYVSMATFKPDATKRVKDQIARVAHVFVEADENGPAVLEAIHASVAANEVPPPTIIVESSPNKYQAIWSVDGFDIATQTALNKTLQMKWGTDPASVDVARVLRVAGFANIKAKYPDPKPIARIIERNPSFLLHEPCDFNVPLTVMPATVHDKAEDSEVQAAIELLLAALDAAQIPHGNVEPWSGAFKILPQECPWADAHTNGMRGDAMVGVQPSGKYLFRCLHGHCIDKDWKAYRAYLEQRAGRKLKFKAKAAKKSVVPKVQSMI